MNISAMEDLNSFFETWAPTSTLDELPMLWPDDETIPIDGAAFQQNELSSALNHDFSFTGEIFTTNTNPGDYNISSISPDPTYLIAEQPTETWESRNMQPIAVTLQPSDNQPVTASASEIIPNFTGPFETRPSLPPLTMNSVVQNQPPSNLMPYLCGICDDRATGKHYGAVSCDGCKGFFRRSVRKSQEYCCRFKRVCKITKDQRNHCRYCRLKKCFSAGMKKEAVQNERDKITYHRPSQKQNHDAGFQLTIPNLLQAEGQEIKQPMVARQAASIQDVCDSMKEELFCFIQWAERLPGFLSLSPADQAALMQARGAENLILGVAKRSLNQHNLLLLGNQSAIWIPNTDSVLRDSENTTRIMQDKIYHISNRIQKELIQPWLKANMDDVEFTCLKTIVFFNPNTKGLVNAERVEQLRDEVQISLENYVHSRQYKGAGRLSKLLLTLLSSQSISKEMVQEMICADIFGELAIDDLLRTMLLNGSTSSN